MLKHVATLSCSKIAMLKNWASCHSRLSYAKWLLKNSCTVILALINSVTERYTEWPY